MRHVLVLVLAAVLTGEAGILRAAPAVEVDCGAAVTQHALDADRPELTVELLVFVGQAFILGTYTESGIPADPPFGADCIRAAADRGSVDALRILGGLHGSGLGVVQDDVLAYQWASLAAMHGDELSKKYRDQLGERLTAAQRAEARRLAHAWLEQ